MIKAAIFDLDGTLLNRDESLRKFIENQYKRLMKHLGHIPKGKYMERFIELDHRGYVWKDRVYQQLVEEFDIVGRTPDELLQDYLDQFKNHCVPFDHLIEMLEELKKNHLSLGIITNGYGLFQMENIKALGIEGYFDVILVSDWEGIKKPNPEIFQRMIKKLGLSAEECIFMGDHPENDVKAAKNVGMKGFWKKDPQWKHVVADFVIDDLSEIALAITTINQH